MREFILDSLEKIKLRKIIIFIKNFILAVKNNSIIINHIRGTKCFEMGLKKKIRLNPLNFNHLNIIQDKNQIDENILGIIHYISKKTLVICSNDILLINFIFYVLKKRFVLLTTKQLKLNKEIKNNLLKDKELKNNYIKNDTFILDDLGIFDILPSVNNVCILSKKKIEDKKFYTYKYLNGRLFALDSDNLNSYFFTTKDKYLQNQKKNKISGFSSIKSLELFPFDLCYESILPHVDELIIGVDTEDLTEKRQKLLKEFLLKTKYKKKIKIIYINFKSKIFNKFKTRGRWIANINNFLLNYCSGQYCLYLQADEFNNDKTLRKKLNNLIQKNVDEINFNFFHYVFNLWTIRDPKKASYSKAIRFFKNDYYFNNYDGYNFYKSKNFLFPKKVSSGFFISHLSYIFSYRRKLDSNFSKTQGLFPKISQKKWLENIYPVKAENLLRHVENYNYLKSTNNIIKDSFKNIDL